MVPQVQRQRRTQIITGSRRNSASSCGHKLSGKTQQNTSCSGSVTNQIRLVGNVNGWCDQTIDGIINPSRSSFFVAEKVLCQLPRARHQLGLVYGRVSHPDPQNVRNSVHHLPAARNLKNLLALGESTTEPSGIFQARSDRTSVRSPESFLQVQHKPLCSIAFSRLLAERSPRHNRWESSCDSKTFYSSTSDEHSTYYNQYNTRLKRPLS